MALSTQVFGKQFDKRPSPGARIGTSVSFGWFQSKELSNLVSSSRHAGSIWTTNVHGAQGTQLCSECIIRRCQKLSCKCHYLVEYLVVGYNVLYKNVDLNFLMIPHYYCSGVDTSTVDLAYSRFGRFLESRNGVQPQTHYSRRTKQFRLESTVVCFSSWLTETVGC